MTTSANEPGRIESITSEQNAVFRTLRDCLTGKGIKKHGLFIVSGERAVRDTLTQHAALARNLLICSDLHMPWPSIVVEARNATRANEPRFSVLSLGRALFEELDVFGTGAPLLVLKTPTFSEADLKQEPKGLEILCALGEPSNVGALLRSAAAFGASRVILLKESSSPFHPKASRAASGATLATTLATGPSIRDVATTPGIVALDMNGEDLTQFKWPKNVRLLIGEEGQGVPDSASFTRVRIPISENVESLNATIAASVALYSYRQKF